MVNRKLADIVKDKKFVVLPEEGTVQEACRCMWECRVGLGADRGQRTAADRDLHGRDAVRSLAEGKDAARRRWRKP